MVRQNEMGGASASPTFDAQVWLADWSDIGGGFARTAVGLALFWHDLNDHVARDGLHRELASEIVTGALIDHLDRQHFGGALS